MFSDMDRDWSTMLFLLTLAALSHAQETCTNMYVPEPIVHSRAGDVSLAYIGQFTNFHGGYCVRKSKTSMRHQYPDLFAYAVSKINDDDAILPNVTLGFTILDGCSSSTVNLARVWTLLLDTCHRVPAGIGTGKLVGMMGPVSSSQLEKVSSSLGLHRVPHIALQATSDDLSDKSRYFMLFSFNVHEF